MSTKSREAVVALAGVAVVAVVLCVIGGRWAFKVHASDTAKANALAAQTSALDVKISEGEQVARHRQTAYAKARQLASAYPSSVDDSSLISAVLNAAFVAGVQTPGETRGAPATGTQALAAIPVSTSANGPNASSVISFVGLLQQQQRAISITSVDLTFTSGSQAAAAGRAYTATIQLPPAAQPSAGS